jgi:hypothetical protein
MLSLHHRSFRETWEHAAATVPAADVKTVPCMGLVKILSLIGKKRLGKNAWLNVNYSNSESAKRNPLNYE